MGDRASDQHASAEALTRDVLADALKGHRWEIEEAGEWRPLADHVLALIESQRRDATRRALERAAAFVDRESHKPGAQGYSGGMRYEEFSRLADRIRALAPDSGTEEP